MACPILPGVSRLLVVIQKTRTVSKSILAGSILAEPGMVQRNPTFTAS
jgi:hypothetical protein